MAVYFVYRSQYQSPNICRMAKFEEKSVLEWFQKHWVGCDFDSSYEYTEKLLGFSAYGYSSLFQNIAEKALAKPTNSKELEDYLREHLYFEKELLFEPNAIQVLTDDDELDVAYYIFDDHYIKENPDRVAFLIHSTWELPTQIQDSTFIPQANTTKISPEGKYKGTVYCAFLSAYDFGSNIEEMSKAWRIEGIRLPELAEYLGTKELGKEIELTGEFPCELLLLRSQLLLAPSRQQNAGNSLVDLQNTPSEYTLWQAFYQQLKSSGIIYPGQYILENALLECSKYPVHALNMSFKWQFAGKTNLAVTRTEIEGVTSAAHWKNQPSKSLVQVEEHFAQASVHTDHWKNPRGGEDLYNRWIMFDDLWAAANKDLANCILRFQERWDVLTK